MPMCVCVCVRACVRACVRVWMCVICYLQTCVCHHCALRLSNKLESIICPLRESNVSYAEMLSHLTALHKITV